MSQHFLLSAKARTLSVSKVARLTDEEAHATFCRLRWPETDDAPVCPHCDCDACYRYASRPVFKCKACERQFSVTSGTLFASRKLPIRDYLLAIAIFVNAVKGVSALQLGRDLDVQYKTAFVLAHKLREAMSAEHDGMTLQGLVEVDGAYFGGYSKPENRKEDRKDRRLLENQTGKRRVVVVMRERGGRTLPIVVRREDMAVPVIRERVKPGTTVYADKASSWDALHARFDVKRINHSVAFFDDGVCTNQAESFFSRLHRAEWGQHHHISGKYLYAYAGEMAWREDARRKANGTQWARVGKAALAAPKSFVWTGYWQRQAQHVVRTNVKRHILLRETETQANFRWPHPRNFGESNVGAASSTTKGLPPMAKKSPWHSVKQSVHHDNTECNTGNNIERENIRQGTGGKPLCAECSRLDRSGR